MSPMVSIRAAVDMGPPGLISMCVSTALPHRGCAYGSVVDGGVFQDSTARMRATFGCWQVRRCSAMSAGTNAQ